VGLIDYNEREAAEKCTPLVVPGKDLVQFMRVGEYDTGEFPDARSFVSRGISIINGR
jgi:hypothetical protein